MEVSARTARAEDVADIAHLAAAAIDELTPHRGGALWRLERARTEPIDEGIAADIDAPDTLVVAGTIDGAVIGYAVARREELAPGQVLARLTDLFTLEGAREVGVGEAMMDAVEAWARETGCSGIDSLALPGDRETKNFFESFGLKARALLVHRALD